MKLLLFDIDGTLLHTHGVGRQAVEEALADVLGRPVHTDGVTFSGKTDPQILDEVMARHGLDASERAARMSDAVGAYTEAMQRHLNPNQVTLLPGILELVSHLHAAPDVQLALLTGNIEPMAYVKLGAVGLGGYFPFGAFGSDSPHRPDLPAIAVERARAHTGRRFAGKDVVIIGDTEHDIACGRGIGAFSVGVCTGRYERDELERHGPDVLFDDLADQAYFVQRVLRLAA